ncbi:MAG: RHS repeat-associated core domain-containing protein, partial [Nitrospira sp.]|nr:RHS repeat-associated core domain-containing protein [Nitrospira sp.]
TYDVASRLTNMLHQGPGGILENLTYQYDAAGNRTSLTRNNAAASLLPAAVASATYDAANEQTAFAGAALTYDANGNLTNDGTHTYISDSRNRLVGVNGPGLVATFAYDALNRRVLKTINGVAIGQLLDGKDIVAEIAGGSIASTYLRSLALDEPFIRTGSTGKEMYHADPLGSTLFLTNETGAVKTTYEYDPFGKTVPNGAISGNPFQYTGRENDGGGLYYYRARYYRPYEQRFTKEDPIGYGGGPNFYAYVENTPIRYTDPDGLLAGTAAGATVGAIAGPLGAAVGAVVGTVVQGAVVGGLIYAVSVTPGDTLTSDAQRQAEWDRAKNFCDRAPSPGSNDCSTLSQLIDHAKKCIELYEAWDRRWSPGRHAEKIQTWRNRLDNLKEEHRKKCSNKCR